MSDDEERAAYRRRRMDELLAEAETDVARTRKATEPPAEPGPVVEAKRRSWFGNALGVLILLAVSAVLLGVSMTLSRFSGHDYADADLRGTATVESCERRGPVSLEGFGYVEQCTVSLDLDGPGPSRVLIDKPGFFKGEKPGDTIEIGQDPGNRGQLYYSRPDFPSRGWVTLIGVLIGFLGVLPLLAAFFYLKDSIKDLFRRRR